MFNIKLNLKKVGISVLSKLNIKKNLCGSSYLQIVKKTDCKKTSFHIKEGGV